MRNIIKILFPVILLFTGSYTFCQESCDPIIKNNQHTNTNYEYVSKKLVNLKPGFSYKAGSSNEFVGKTNPSIICSLDNDNIVDGGYNEQNPYQHNNSLPVGSIAGQAAVSPTGAATYTIPIFTSPGTAGMEPSISIVYNSLSGSGILGTGWHLSGLSEISLAPNKYYLDGYNESVKYDIPNGSYTSKRYQTRFALDGMQLILVNGIYGENNSEYRTEIDNFNKIIYINNCFEVHSKDGMISYYGTSNNSKLKIGSSYSDTKVLSWHLDKVMDRNGNYIEYEYYDISNHRERPIKKITYTGNEIHNLDPINEIEFLYSERSDNSRSYIGNTFLTQNLILNGINIKQNEEILKRYVFKYTVSPYSTLSEVIEYDNSNKKLNSTVIEWGNKDYSLTKPINNNVTTNLFLNESGIGLEYINQITPITGDFNGDGILDFAYIFKNYENERDIPPRKIILQLYLGKKDGGFTKTEMIKRDEVKLYVENNRDVYSSERYIISVGDINYDGKDEIILSNITDAEASIYYSLNDNNYSFSIHNTGKSLTRQYLAGNYYGNGMPSFLEYIIENNYSGISLEYTDYISNNFTLTEKAVSNPFTGGLLHTAPEENNIFRNAPKQNIDFDGDGITDILGIREIGNNAYINIYEYNGTTQKFEDLILNTTRINPNKYRDSLNYYYRFADFNGDGKTDFMAKESVKNKTWKIYKSTGQYFSEDFSFTSSLQPEKYSNSYNIYTVDMNGDGKADIVEYLTINNTSATLKISIAVGHGKFQTFISSLDIKNQNTRDLVFGDFNGDGKMDIIYYDGDGKFKYAYFMLDDKSNKVKSITNGLNFKNEFEYCSLTHNNIDNNNIITPNKETYPLKSSMSVVSKYRQSNGLNQQMIEKSYKYINGNVHVKGKGFLGFDEIHEEIAADNTIIKTINELNYDHYTTSKTINKVEIDNVLVINKEDVFYIRKMSPPTQHYHIAIVPGHSTTYESLRNQTSYEFVTYVYKNFASGAFYGNLEKVTKKIHGENRIITNYYNYVNNGSWCESKPEKITVTRTQEGDTESFVQNKNIVYNDKGAVVKTTSYAISPLENQALIEEYIYDDYGNISNIKQTGVVDELNNSQDRTISYEYDPNGRFPIKETDVLGLVTEKSYNNFFGTITRFKDTFGHITSYEYDGFGNLTKIHLPQGHTTSIEIKWMPTIQNDLAYYITTIAPGTPKITTWYDILGREVKSKSNYYDKELMTRAIYRPDGLIMKKSLPYFSNTEIDENDNEKWTEFSYDIFKRPSSVKKLGLTTTYSYSVYGETTITEPDGKSRKEKQNFSGQTILVNSPVGSQNTVSYTYSANGKPKKINANGIETSMSYDINGNQTSLVDADAGTTNYNYNAFGELIKQTDANGNIFTIFYDNAGRITSKKCNNNQYSTTYTYYPSGLLQKENINTGVYKLYEYDEYGKLILMKEYINGVIHNHSYTYDEYDNVKTYTYPSGYTIKNEYNDYSFLTGVYENDNTPIWKLSNSNSINEMGQFLNYKLGPNSINSNFSYNSRYFTLDRIEVGSAFNYKYEFNPINGNLISREDRKRNLKEEFSYDNLDRLLSWKNLQTNVKHELTYDNNGNILSKTDVGEYAYNIARPHAVTKITANSSTTKINQWAQNITYNPLHKTSRINEVIDGIDYKYDITYGTDSERKFVRIFINNSSTYRKYYSGLYEKEISYNSDYSQTTKEVHYIPTGDGISAVHVKTNNNQNGDTYYLIKDYLGSVMSLINANGTVVQNHSYDPWGNLRNPNDWTYNNVNTDFIVNRGYTGHEMLTMFGLINMNGRMYDPVIGRVLSPDNYVQSPFNAQNYNRYSYCYNNPLKYIDPSGNAMIMWPWSRSYNDNTLAKNVVRDVAGNPIGPNGSINKFGESGNKSPWGGNNGVFTDASGAKIELDILSKNHKNNPIEFHKKFYYKQLTASIEEGPLYSPNESDGCIYETATGKRNDEYIYLGYANLVKSDEIRNFDGFVNRLEFIWNGGNFDGVQYNWDGEPIGASPKMGYPPAVGLNNPTNFINSTKDVFNFTGTAAKHMGEASRKIPIHTLNDIIKAPIHVTKDPQGTKALMHYSQMWKNGKQYNVEVLYDKTTSTIMHFKYATRALGPLPKIR